MLFSFQKSCRMIVVVISLHSAVVHSIIFVVGFPTFWMSPFYNRYHPPLEMFEHHLTDTRRTLRLVFTSEVQILSCFFHPLTLDWVKSIICFLTLLFGTLTRIWKAIKGPTEKDLPTWFPSLLWLPHKHHRALKGAQNHWANWSPMIGTKAVCWRRVNLMTMVIYQLVLSAMWRFNSICLFQSWY